MSLRHVLALVLVVLAIAPFGAVPARAIEITRQGDAVLLSGVIGPGDADVLREWLENEGPASGRTLWLSSPGGSIGAARDMGRLLRREGWTTVVDAARFRCLSACTILFSAGVRRHYLGTQRLRIGVQPPVASWGLGYHQGTEDASRQLAGFSGMATVAVIGAYVELGTPFAAALPDRAPPDRLYVLSGEEALARGIATSLTAP